MNGPKDAFDQIQNTITTFQEKYNNDPEDAREYIKSALGAVNKSDPAVKKIVDAILPLAPNLKMIVPAKVSESHLLHHIIVTNLLRAENNIPHASNTVDAQEKDNRRPYFISNNVYDKIKLHTT